MGSLDRPDVLRVDRQICASTGEIIAMRKVFAARGFTARAAGNLYASRIVDEPAISGRIFRMIRLLSAQPVFEPLPQSLVFGLFLDPSHLLPQIGTIRQLVQDIESPV